jgi:hypothetical protein
MKQFLFKIVVFFPSFLTRGEVLRWVGKLPSAERNVNEPPRLSIRKEAERGCAPTSHFQLSA